MYLKTLALVATLGGRAVANTPDSTVYKHVVTFSIDGAHGSDLEKYVALRPASTIATLLKTAYKYTDCYTSAPSDSYPGVAAFVTGASPRTTGMTPHLSFY
jgi:predicted AlkP superfamily pyrophosphatase or phosphodiesterase